jgi:hypothetical protein
MSVSVIMSSSKILVYVQCFHQVHGYVVTSLSLRVLNGVVLVEGERDSVHCDTVSTSLQVVQ